MDLVLDIGKHRLKGAAFEGGILQGSFTLPLEIANLQTVLEHREYDAIYIFSLNPAFEKQTSILPFSFSKIDFSKITVAKEVDTPEEVTPYRIANVFGALHHFPQNDCIVVDLGRAITFDIVGRQGAYLGGAICSGPDFEKEMLGKFAFNLPTEEVPKTTQQEIELGLYYGLLGKVERITSELRLRLDSMSDVKVLATGGLISRFESDKLTEDLSELVDTIDPALTLTGIYEIALEQKEK